MQTYRVPGVDRLCAFGRWTFADFTNADEIQGDFEAKLEAPFEAMIDGVPAVGAI